MSNAPSLWLPPYSHDPAGIRWAEDLLAHSRSTSHRRVMDVSGDGPNNSGPLVEPVRDKLVASGVSINGLPISFYRGYSNTFESFDAGFLESYYEHCVIGGPDAFVIGIEGISVRSRHPQKIGSRDSWPFHTHIARLLSSAGCYGRRLFGGQTGSGR